MIYLEDLLYKGKVKIIGTPNRELSPMSEYPSLIGLEGKIVRISGGKIGVLIDNKFNSNSRYGCYWFDLNSLSMN